MKEKEVILIVDDVASNIQTLAAILKDEYQIKVAISGERALEIMNQESKLDLVILDVEMPQMNGYEVLEKLQEMKLAQNIPVIFVTGNVDPEDEEKGLLLGAVDYITKPVRPAIVKARIKTHIILKRQRDELIYIASHDKLTGLYNRHYLAELGRQTFASARRHSDSMSVIMCDVDYFKAINDNHGHLNGDKVLQAVGSLLKSNTRTEDFSARFGGEEFVVVVWRCNAQEAKNKAEKIRKELSELEIDSIKVTASFGVVQLSHKHENFEDLLKEADEALYRAKENGRNRVEVF